MTVYELFDNLSYISCLNKNYNYTKTLVKTKHINDIVLKSSRKYYLLITAS